MVASYHVEDVSGSQGAYRRRPEGTMGKSERSSEAEAEALGRWTSTHRRRSESKVGEDQGREEVDPTTCGPREDLVSVFTLNFVRLGRL